MTRGIKKARPQTGTRSRATGARSATKRYRSVAEIKRAYFPEPTPDELDVIDGRGQRHNPLLQQPLDE
jgi:hypothetical protein